MNKNNQTFQSNNNYIAYDKHRQIPSDSSNHGSQGVKSDKKTDMIQRKSPYPHKGDAIAQQCQKHFENIESPSI